MKKIQQKKLATAICIVLLVVPITSRSEAAGQYGRNNGPAPMKYGYALNSQLSYFAPASASYGLHLLMDREYTEAADELQKQYILHPASLPIYAGLAQVSPQLVNAEIAKDNDVPVSQLSDLDQFKLATSLYYSWSIQWYGPRAAMVEKSQRLLDSLWLKSKLPVVGLMLSETVTTCGSEKDPSVKGLEPVTIMDDLIGSIGGPVVRDVYAQAKAQDWQAEPPTDKTVPTANLRSLLAIVCSRGSFYHYRSGPAKLVNNVLTPDFQPYTVEQLAAQHYFDTWVAEMYTDLGLHPLNGK